MKTLTIGRVAKQAGVGVETVRFYERRGLLETPPRRPSGYREYGEDAVARLRFIRRAKQLGFTLREIKELLALRRDPSNPGGDLKRRAEAKIAEIELKIRTLQKMKKALVKLTVACREHGATAECPLLRALGESDESW